MTSLEVFYLLCAITGGVLFTLRAIMFFVAGGFDAEFGSDMDGAHGLDLDSTGMDLDVGHDFNMDGLHDFGMHDAGMAGLQDTHGMDAAHTNTRCEFQIHFLAGIDGLPS